MKIAVLLTRHRRLVALCGLSACVHLLMLDLAARRTPAPLPPAGAGAPLALRLVPAAQTAPPAQRLSMPAGAAPQQAAPAPPATTRTTPEPPARAQPSPLAHAPVPAAAADDQAGPERVLTVASPATYRAALPPPARLAYRLQDAPAGAPPVYLDWRPDSAGYSLELDGVLGRLSSRGISGDTGMQPVQATESVAGSASATRFDAAAGQVEFEAGGVRLPAAIGVQDRASVLLQLAAIGRAAPEQLREPVRIAVAGDAALNIEEYRLLGEETVDTGIGSVAAWHLAQLAAPGRPRLELWLAPSQDWLPVQLRLTRADGSMSTQVLAGADRSAARP